MRGIIPRVSLCKHFIDECKNLERSTKMKFLQLFVGAVVELSKQIYYYYYFKC